MPTTIPFVSAAAQDQLLGGERPAIESNRDLRVIALFCLTGLAVAIALALLFPSAANDAYLLLSVS